MTSMKNLPKTRRPHWCSQSLSSNDFEELNRICEETKIESVICRLSVERKGSDQAVVLHPNIISIMSDISQLSDSALHCFNPLEVGVRPFEVTPDDIILWNEGDSTEIIDIEENNAFCIKFTSGIPVKDERVIMLSDFEKQMILLADTNNRKTLNCERGSDKKPSPEQVDKVYNVLRTTVSKVIHTDMYLFFRLLNTHRSMLKSIIPAFIWNDLEKPSFLHEASKCAVVHLTSALFKNTIYIEQMHCLFGCYISDICTVMLPAIQFDPNAG